VANDLARNLITAGVHFGHTVSRWNPKMKPYVYTRRGMIHIINVRETLRGIILARKLLKDIVSSGRDVVFIGTKRQAQKAVKAAAEATGMHYVTNRWLGGTLTNFRTIHSRIQRLDELEAMAADGSIESESKKRASTLKRELRKVKSNLEGIRKMNQVPGVLVVVDARREHLALREAKKTGIPTIGIIDTDSDPDTVDIAIPGNDDSVKAIDIIIGELAAAVAEGKTTYRAPVRDEAGRAPRVRRRSLARAGESAESEVAAGPENAPPAPESAKS